MRNTFLYPKKTFQKLATWGNYDGATQRQIDYFDISKISRNWVINIDNKEMTNARTPTQRK